MAEQFAAYPNAALEKVCKKWFDSFAAAAKLAARSGDRLKDCSNLNFLRKLFRLEQVTWECGKTFWSEQHFSFAFLNFSFLSFRFILRLNFSV